MYIYRDLYHFTPKIVVPCLAALRHVMKRQVEKRLYFGEVDSMAQASISWTDGEKWLKK